MDTPDLLADRYRLGPILGRGGMGVVYRAHDEQLGRDVAVKLLDVGQAPQQALQRFRREAQFLAGLSHPNVVTVFDFGTDEDRAWLVMELLPGPTLQQLVEQRGPLPIDDVMRYGRQSAAALGAAHAAGITHRDVKPANLMLAADGTCKLLDLGIARLDGAAGTEPALTRTGTILGTVSYLAPEVITGEVPRPPADLYALGGVLFALLTARAPFQGDQVMAAMAQHVHAPVPRPSTLRSDVPPDLDDLVHALLAKDPVARPTAVDVVSRLDGSPAAALAPTAALTAPRTAAIAATAAMPSPPRRRSRTGLIAGGIALALIVLLVALVLANSGSDTSGQASGSGGVTATHHATAPTTMSPHTTAAHTTAAHTTAPRTSSARPSPSPTDLAGALSALRTAITTAQASGEVSPADAQDLLRRTDALAAAASGPAAGPPPGGPKPGKDNGKGKGKGPGPGQDKKTGDLSGQLADFRRHLDDLRSRGALAAPAYSSIRSALLSVASFAGSSGDGGD